MDNTIIDGRYQVIAAIGAGGEAYVYQARDLDEDACVALRLGRPGSKIPDDADAASALTHPNWVRLLAVGRDRDFGVYQIFELIEGRTLAQYISGGPFTPEEWLAFVAQSLDAVGALHDVGRVHGDLNADNFILAKAGWKLLELPFLRFEPPRARTAAFGSIHTLAPEQIDGKPAGPASDLYSLGCLYYFAASGRYPNPGGTAQEIAIHRLRYEPEPLHPLAPDLPAAQADGVMALLARQAGDRPATVAAARQLLGVA